MFARVDRGGPHRSKGQLTRAFIFLEVRGPMTNVHVHRKEVQPKVPILPRGTTPSYGYLRQKRTICISIYISRPTHTQTTWPIQTRVGNSLIGFLSKSLIFCEQRSDSLVKKSELLQSLFCKDRRERFTPVSLLKRVTERIAMGSICSWA